MPTGPASGRPDDRLRIEPGISINQFWIPGSPPSKSAVADLDIDIAELG
jgi:hypothetical protein